jgi:radical SAM protein with 4Fe4S-binding SPASM domain
MKQNLHVYRAVYDLAQELGAEFQADYRLAPKSNMDSSPLNFHIDRDGVSQVFSDGLFLKDSDSAVELHSGLFDSGPCGASHMAAYISPYGDVYPCVQLPLMCGNLRELSFEDIWTKSPAMKQVRSIRIADLTACSTCTLIRYCRPCIGLSYLEERSLLAPLKRACEEAAIIKATGEERRRHQ